MEASNYRGVLTPSNQTARERPSFRNYGSNLTPLIPSLTDIPTACTPMASTRRVSYIPPPSDIPKAMTTRNST